VLHFQDVQVHAMTFGFIHTTHALHNDEHRNNHIVGLLRLTRQLRRLAQRWLREWHLRTTTALPLEWMFAAVAQAGGLNGQYEPLNSAGAKS
jgi:hypothetical protein